MKKEHFLLLKVAIENKYRNSWIIYLMCGIATLILSCYMLESCQTLPAWPVPMTVFAGLCVCTFLLAISDYGKEKQRILLLKALDEQNRRNADIEEVLNLAMFSTALFSK